jgi:lipoate-protein ligase A
MWSLDLTLPSPAENLALDEALLEVCDTSSNSEVLRFWEPTQFFVVVGYANRVETEVNAQFCHEQNIPIIRRCTGGGTVLQGQGCLNYSLVLRLERGPALQSISGTNEYVLGQHAAALSQLLGKSVIKMGHTDLALGSLKFSGNAQRRRKNALLFHGSFLLRLDLNMVENSLLLPSKQPEYRLNRSHRDFLINLQTPAQAIKSALRQTWGATEAVKRVPLDQVAALVRSKYGRTDWNLKF